MEIGEQVERWTEILKKVKAELMRNLDKLKDAEYEEGWKDVLVPLKEVGYIETGFFGNLAQALSDELNSLLNSRNRQMDTCRPNSIA